jgi:peptidoglycan/LPS O-acetylase OafA/YrhL
MSTHFVRRTSRSEPEAAPDALASRDNNFVALRLLFALLVLVGHSDTLARAKLAAAGAGVAVRAHGFDVGFLATYGLIGFFAISGYLVCGSYLSSRSVWSYLWKRVLRIGPAFLVVALVSVLLVGPLGADDGREYFRDLNLAAQLRAIATLHVSTMTMHAFPHNPNHELNGPTWSLPVEFALYMLVALLGMTTLLRRRWPVVLVWASLVVLGVFIAMFQPPWAAIARFAQGTMQKFVPLYVVFLGGALMRLYPILRRSALVAPIVALCVIGNRMGVGLLGECVAAPLVVIWVGEHPIRLPRTRDDLSYGIYLIAWPIQQLLLEFLPLGALLLAMGTTVISASLATLSWRFIESPALRFKDVSVGSFLRSTVKA